MDAKQLVKEFDSNTLPGVLDGEEVEIRKGTWALVFKRPIILPLPLHASPDEYTAKGLHSRPRKAGARQAPGYTMTGGIAGSSVAIRIGPDAAAVSMSLPDAEKTIRALGSIPADALSPECRTLLHRARVRAGVGEPEAEAVARVAEVVFPDKPASKPASK